MIRGYMSYRNQNKFDYRIQNRIFDRFYQRLHWINWKRTKNSNICFIHFVLFNNVSTIQWYKKTLTNMIFEILKYSIFKVKIIFITMAHFDQCSYHRCVWFRFVLFLRVNLPSLPILTSQLQSQFCWLYVWIYYSTWLAPEIERNSQYKVKL